MAKAEPLLTSLSHGGGCGCKIAPSALRAVLARLPPTAAFPDLLVGRETSDDAAVYRLNEGQALVATTDFFMPILDDPFVFGRISATNALSDIYAMGGRPILALAIVGMPVNVLSEETIGLILEGGAAACAAAGIPVAGGHSIDSVEPIYGLAALGLVHPERILTNRRARPGDQLILTKPIGVGVFSAALKQNRLSPEDYAAFVASTTALNAVGAELGALEGVHAMTDVTGFGLLGHALEMAEGSGRRLSLDWDSIPVFPGAEALAREGVRTGASQRNWDSVRSPVELASGFGQWRRDLLCDPQTSGGLLISVSPAAVGEVLARAAAAGFHHARRIGEVQEGPSGLSVMFGGPTG